MWWLPTLNWESASHGVPFAIAGLMACTGFLMQWGGERRCKIGAVLVLGAVVLTTVARLL